MYQHRDSGGLRRSTRRKIHGIHLLRPAAYRRATTLGPVRFAYLTKMVCLKHAPPGCPRDIHSFKSMGSYGAFGAGLTGKIFGKHIAPPPLLHLPGRYGLFYSIVLGADSGDLILGSRVPPGATMFRLIKTSTVKGQRWAQGGACLFVNEQPINTCLTVSFDTGNGLPWLHNVTNPLLPLSCTACGDCATCGGTVVAGTRPPENVVEGSVLQHQNDNVLDLAHPLWLPLCFLDAKGPRSRNPRV
jgi:hypothetical protein